jgi:Mg2+/citrate symporter
MDRWRCLSNNGLVSKYLIPYFHGTIFAFIFPATLVLANGVFYLRSKGLFPIQIQIAGASSAKEVAKGERSVSGKGRDAASRTANCSSLRIRQFLKPLASDPEASSREKG